MNTTLIMMDNKTLKSTLKNFAKEGYSVKCYIASAIVLDMKDKVTKVLGAIKCGKYWQVLINESNLSQLKYVEKYHG